MGFNSAFKELISFGSKKQTQMYMSECTQTFKLTENVGQGFILCSTHPT
jgi:hypothetical protein